MKITALLSAFLLPLALPAQTGKDFAPLQVGNSWTYAGGNGAEVISLVDRTDEVNGILCAVVATKMQGQLVNEEWLAIQDGALRSYQNRTADGRTMTFGKPIIRLQFPVKNGDRWTSSTMDETGDTLRGSYTVEYPVALEVAGKSYDTAKVAASIRSAQGTMNMETWYAEGVGIVKQAYHTQQGEMAFTMKDCKLARADRPAPKRDEDTPAQDEEHVTPKPKAGAVKCDKCGEPIAAGKKFCGECGAAAPKPKPAEATTCSACNSKLPRGAKFCGECGAKAGAGSTPESKRSDR